MDTINVSDLKSLIVKAHATLCVVLHALDTKILVGEINHPTDSVVKVKRKRRTKKEMKEIPSKSMMDLEKEYQAERTQTIPLMEMNEDLPEDKDPFFAKVKGEKEEGEEN